MHSKLKTYEIIKHKDGAQDQPDCAPTGHEAQDYPKMHLPHQAQELTTSSSTGARGLGRSSRNHKARCAGGGRTDAEGGLDGAGAHTTTTSSAASSSTSTSGRAENTRDTSSRQGRNTNGAWGDQNDDH